LIVYRNTAYEHGAKVEIDLGNAALSCQYLDTAYRRSNFRQVLIKDKIYIKMDWLPRFNRAFMSLRMYKGAEQSDAKAHANQTQR